MNVIIIKKYLTAFLLLIAVLLSAGCGKAEDKRPPVEITVFSIGKADAVLVRADDSVMLIDCGETKNTDVLLTQLGKMGVTHIDILQITHFDKDHVGGAAQIVKNIDTDRIIYPDYEGTRSEYFLFMETIKNHKAAGAVAETAEFTLGNASLTVYPAEDPGEFTGGDNEYDNEMSLVTRMRYGDKVFLFCGDAEKKRLKQMCGSDVDWNCDWIKLPHHGEYSKKLSEFLEQCSPAYAVATVSEYEPADSKLKELLASLGTEYYDTLGGNVVTKYDGENIGMSVVKP